MTSGLMNCGAVLKLNSKVVSDSNSCGEGKPPSCEEIISTILVNIAFASAGVTYLASLVLYKK